MRFYFPFWFIWIICRRCQCAAAIFSSSCFHFYISRSLPPTPPPPPQQVLNKTAFPDLFRSSVYGSQFHFSTVYEYVIRVMFFVFYVCFVGLFYGVLARMLFNWKLYSKRKEILRVFFFILFSCHSGPISCICFNSALYIPVFIVFRFYFAFFWHESKWLKPCCHEGSTFETSKRTIHSNEPTDYGKNISLKWYSNVMLCNYRFYAEKKGIYCLWSKNYGKRTPQLLRIPHIQRALCFTNKF